MFALALAGSAGAQSPQRPVTIRADSVRILRGAKSAQMRFESRRRFLAPRISIGSTGACQMIGRFCRRTSGLPFDEIPEEPDGITRARDDLLRVLASASVKLPGDGWIAGQRVRYLVEAGNYSLAYEAAQSCAAEQWWCDALNGLVLHASNRFAAAEQAFARSLNEMPAEKRCEWTDLSELLDGTARREYTKLSCASRVEANRRIWWLADPLFSTPGNERRTEHYARHTWAEIDRGGANGFGLSWGADMMEMIVRFGWAEKWTQRPPSGFGDASRAYTAHEREPDFHFLPLLPFDAPLRSFGDSAWRLDQEDPREGYSPRYAGTFLSLQPQVARFRRGDSTLVVAAFDVRNDTAWKHVAVHPALVIAPGDTSRFLLALFDSTPRRSALWVTAPAGESLASLELLSLDGKAAGRWRAAISPVALDSARRGISDLLFFDASDSLPATLEGAIAAAYGTNVVLQERKIGVYWETYGAAAGDSSQPSSLTLTPIAPGLVTRIVRALGVGKTLAPVDLRWRDGAPGANVQPHSILLDLSRVTPGRYDLRIGVGGSAVKSPPRTIQIR